MPFMLPLRRFVEFFWGWAEGLIPGLAVYMPRDAVVGIIDSIEIGIDKKLDVDVKIHNVFQIMGVMKEISEAALTRTPEERREAIWSLLEFVTDVENHMTKDEFMTYARQAPLPGD